MHYVIVRIMLISITTVYVQQRQIRWLFVCDVMIDCCRWREDQIKLRASDVASSLRSRPASIDVLAQQIVAEHGLLNNFTVIISYNI